MKKNEEKKNKNIFGKAAVILLILFLLGIIAFCLYKIYETSNMYREIDEKNEEIVSKLISVNTEEDTEGNDTSTDDGFPDYVYDHAAALAINSDTVGMLYIPSTGVLLPVVQTTDNSYYLRRALDRTYLTAGTLFVDFRCTDALDSMNVIIYGHNMRNGSMFGTNKKYKDEDFYFKEGNNVFYVYGDGYIREYLIYMTGYAKTNAASFQASFESTAELVEYAQEMQSSYSFYDTGVDVSSATQVVTLSTCTGNGYTQRMFIQGMLVREKDTETGEITTDFTDRIVVSDAEEEEEQEADILE